MEHFQKSYELSVELEDVEGIGISYINFASIYRNQEKFEKALEFHKKGLEVKEKMNDKSGQSLALCEIGKDYESLGNHEKGI